MKDIIIIIFYFCAVGSLCVHGVQGNTGFFWQVSDFHYDPSYSSSYGIPFDMCHQGSEPTYTQLGEFGNYLCDAPWKLVVSAIQAMKYFYPNPDFILWTGDSIPRIRDADNSLEKVYINIGNVTDELRKTFPTTSIYPVLGNHDSYPSDKMPCDVQVSNYYRQILTISHWDSLLDNNCQKQFQQGGYFSVSPHSGLRIIALNTNLYGTLNTLTDGLPDPANQFLWLEKQLDDARKNQEKVFLVAHIPPGSSEKIPNFPWFYKKYNQRYLDLLRKHADIITAQFYAHEHTDSFRLLYDRQRNEMPVGCLLLSPSVTPWRSLLTGLEASNPSIRLYEYDLETGIIQRYKQFYLNLTAANIDGNAVWLQEYETQGYYGLDKITPHGMQQLVNSFYNSKNSIFYKYFIFNSVSKETAPVCNSKCFWQSFCAITKLDTDEYDDCIARSKTTRQPETDDFFKNDDKIFVGIGVTFVVILVGGVCACVRATYKKCCK